MMLSLEELHLEGQNREQLIYIALDILDAILLPSPYLGRDIVVDRDVGVFLDIFGNIEVETRIVDKDDHIRLPRYNVALGLLHITQNGRQMQQHRHKTHIGQLTIMFYTHTTSRLHQVTTIESELCCSVLFLQGHHES